MSEPSCLTSTSTRGLLRRYVAPRVPPSDVDDVIQATLLDAVASARAPDEDADIRHWLIAIARHKVADAHRARVRARRDQVMEEPTCTSSVEALAIAEWAVRQIP